MTWKIISIILSASQQNKKKEVMNLKHKGSELKEFLDIQFLL